MDRRRFLLTSLAGAVAAPLAGEAQEPQARIGVLGTVGTAVQELEHSLRELGWVEGRNLVIEKRLASSYDGLARYARELTQLGVEVIVCTNAPALSEPRRVRRRLSRSSWRPPATRSLPVSSRISRVRAETSLASPSCTRNSAESVSSSLVDAIPGAKRIAVFSNPNNPSTPAMLQETLARARALGVETVPFEATTVDQVVSRFALIAQQRVAGVAVLGDPFFYEERRRLVSLALHHRLPGVYEWGDMAEVGGLMAYGPRRADLRRTAAEYVHRILKGARPGDLPVEQPTKFELIINLKTAKALGLTIPPSLLARADQVLE